MTAAARRDAPADESGWHVVYTKLRQESCALENLQRQGFELPILATEPLPAGRLAIVPEVLPAPPAIFLYTVKPAVQLVGSSAARVKFGGVVDGLFVGIEAELLYLYNAADGKVKGG